MEHRIYRQVDEETEEFGFLFLTEHGYVDLFVDFINEWCGEFRGVTAKALLCIPGQFKDLRLLRQAVRVASGMVASDVEFALIPPQHRVTLGIVLARGHFVNSAWRSCQLSWGRCCSR